MSITKRRSCKVLNGPNSSSPSNSLTLQVSACLFLFAILVLSLECQLVDLDLHCCSSYRC
jgi:hypothetical protein